MGSICGYCGTGNDQLVEQMLGRLEHRGPSGQATWSNPRIGLGCNSERTDLGYPNYQVATSRDGNVTCVLDGYLFNQQQLAADLAEQGIELEKQDPAQIAANWFMLEGTDCFTRFDGAFTLALVSGDELLLVRDALGERPLYYCTQSWETILFASEIKAFLANDQFQCDSNPEALNRLLVFSFLPGEETMFRGVRELLPGHFIRWTPSGLSPQQQYWDLQENITDHDEEYYVDRMRELTYDAVRKRLVVDGPVGAFLSGGLDSSAVVAILADLGVETKTYSIGFGAGLPNELMYARLVAEHWDLEHQIMHVEPKMFLDLLPNIIWNLDDPLCDCIVVPNYLLASQAGKDVKLLFNGEGGDPLFGGPKNKFMIIHNWYKQLTGEDTTQAYLSSYHKFYDYMSDVYRGKFRKQLVGDKDLESFVRPVFEGEHPRSFLNKLMYLNTKLKGGQNILVKVDKMLSAHALPAMSPLFDRTVAEFSFTMPTHLKRQRDVEKYVFKKSIDDKLPTPVVYRKKAGMGVPLNYWFLRTELRGYAHDLLLSKRCRERGIFSQKLIRRLLKGQMPKNAIGQNRSGEMLWMMMAVELWHQVFIDQRGLL